MKQLKIYLEESDYDRVKEEAELSGQSLSEYVRIRLTKTASVEMKIDFGDITEYVLLIEKLSNQVVGICPIIYQSNKTFEQDVTTLLSLLEKINATCDAVWVYINNTRTELYDQTRKELVKQVRANGYKRRRKLKTEQGENDNGSNKA